MASREMHRWEQKKELYALFEGKIETAVIDMVFGGCNDQEDSSDVKIIESTAKGFPSDTEMEEAPRNKQKTMFILRGLPGSGKSYLANQLKQYGDTILSTDNFFRAGKGFEFRGDQLQDAHDWNLACARSAMRREDVNNIYIDNTNTRSWEMKPYVLAALNHGYNVEFLMPQTPWAWNINELERRNTHGVPKGTLQKMLDRFEKDVTVEKVLASDKAEPQAFRPFEKQIHLSERSRRALETKAVSSFDSRVAAPFSKNALLDEFSNVVDHQLENDLRVSSIATQETETRGKPQYEINPSLLPRRSEDFPVVTSEMVIDDNFDAELDLAYTSMNSKGDKLAEYDDKDFEIGMSRLQRESSPLVQQSKYGAKNSRTENPIVRSRNEKPESRDNSPKAGLPPSVMNETDLNFLLECFPDYENDVLKSVFMRFDGDIQRTCNEIMEQPLVKMSAFDRLQSINKSFIDDKEKVEFEEDVSEQTKGGPVFLHVKPQVDSAQKFGNFAICLDKTFVIEMKRILGEGDIFEDDDFDFPVDAKFANQIYQQWQRHCKAKRKRLENETMNDEGKHLRIEEAVHQRPKRPCSSEKVPSVLEEARNEDRERLKGSFSPWAISKPPGITIDHKLQEPRKPIWDSSFERSENRLYTLFPTVEKDVLDNIYEAMGNDVEAAIQAVKASLNYQEQNKKASGSERKAEPPRPPEETRTGFVPVRTMVGKDTVIRLKPESEPMLEEGRIASPVPVADDKWTVVQGKNTNYVDLTTVADDDNFQSLSGTSYADYRAEAQAHAAIRKEWLRKAAQAYQNKQVHVWSYCAGEARKQADLMKEANGRAAALIFEKKNTTLTDPTSIDLHGLHCDEAVEMLEETLSQAMQRKMRYIDIVTGRGSHSRGKVPRITGGLCDCDQLGATGTRYYGAIDAKILMLVPYLPMYPSS
eukprot:gene544-10229_t